jgi:hypothetical protein
VKKARGGRGGSGRKPSYIVTGRVSRGAYLANFSLVNRNYPSGAYSRFTTRFLTYSPCSTIPSIMISLLTPTLSRLSVLSHLPSLPWRRRKPYEATTTVVDEFSLSLMRSQPGVTESMKVPKRSGQRWSSTLGLPFAMSGEKSSRDARITSIQDVIYSTSE